MNTKDIKTYLKRARFLENDIQSKIREQNSLKSSFLKSPSIKDINVQESNKVFDDKYVGLIELSKSIDERIDELYAFKKTVTDQIDNIPDNLCRSILRDYYLNNFSWETIAELNNQSLRNVYNIHGEALKLFGYYNSID